MRPDEEIELRRKVNALSRRVSALEKERAQRDQQSLEDSWRLNPDRSGGAFSDEEIARASAWI